MSEIKSSNRNDHLVEGVQELSDTCHKQQSMLDALPEIYERREKMLLEQIEALTADRMAWKATAFRAESAIAAQGAEPVAKHWHDLYRAECQKRQDDVAMLGGQIEGLELVAAEHAEALKDAARYRWLKANNRCEGWRDVEIDRQIAIDAAIASAEGGVETKAPRRGESLAEFRARTPSIRRDDVPGGAA